MTEIAHKKTYLLGLFSITKQEVPYYGDIIVSEKGSYQEQLGICQQNHLDILNNTPLHVGFSVYNNYKKTAHT